MGFLRLFIALLPLRLLANDETGAFMPTQGSIIAADVDHLYGFLLAASLISFIILMGGMTYFLVKYRRKTPNDKTPHISHNSLLEFTWSFIPFCIFMLVFAWGAYVFYRQRVVPEKPYVEVQVKAWQWAWEFQYPNGKKSDVLMVPKGRPVRLLINSIDVIHSFYVPDFRIQENAMPGMYNTAWFEAPNEGEHQIYCTEYCGTQHSAMEAKIKVVDEVAFDEWLWTDSSKGKSLAQLGKELYNAKGCVACHSLDGSTMTGPSWKGLFGKEREFTNGSKAAADENYLRESILQSQAKVVKGFGPVMPSFQGLISEDEVKQLIEFIKSLNN